ncbi:hypothetical protein WJX75_003696 [Coccomyxa subellipsoidea]|uniref:SGNH hydrolase-type esterase domain-containing protein n=1 Tax=Coccomyxa subellipsoidea TaxID=248742 RepID=A0ABR2YXH8_9CHLO
MQQDSPDGGIDLLFYGDSLTELWRGTAWGYNSRLGGGIPAVFSRYFGQYRSVVCGSGGDTTANLWWRIQNGELPRNHQPKLAVVMIGANDLTAAYVQCGTWDQSSYYNAAANIAQQVSGIVGTIHASWPGTRVIVMGILPRGTDYWDGGSASRNWPNVLTPAINALNNALQEMASATSMTSYLYCGAAFSSGSGLANLQDGQHPNVAGYEALGQPYALGGLFAA